MLGFPSVGKSTLMTRMTGTFSEVAAYEFTTLTTVPGFDYFSIYLYLYLFLCPKAFFFLLFFIFGNLLGIIRIHGAKFQVQDTFGLTFK